jgi:hypothetical protein
MRKINRVQLALILRGNFFVPLLPYWKALGKDAFASYTLLYWRGEGDPFHS